MIEQVRQLVHPSTELLVDRAVPGRRTNFDLIAVAPSGVWIIDVKRFNGRIAVRFDRGRDRLYVNERERTDLVEGALAQLVDLAEIIADPLVPARAALAFDEADYSTPALMKLLLNRPLSASGVLIGGPKTIAQAINGERKIPQNYFALLVERLQVALPSR